MKLSEHTCAVCEASEPADGWPYVAGVVSRWVDTGDRIEMVVDENADVYCSRECADAEYDGDLE